MLEAIAQNWTVFSQSFQFTLAAVAIFFEDVWIWNPTSYCHPAFANIGHISHMEFSFQETNKTRSPKPSRNSSHICCWAPFFPSLPTKYNYEHTLVNSSQRDEMQSHKVGSCFANKSTWKKFCFAQAKLDAKSSFFCLACKGRQCWWFTALEKKNKKKESKKTMEERKTVVQLVLALNWISTEPKPIVFTRLIFFFFTPVKSFHGLLAIWWAP